MGSTESGGGAEGRKRRKIRERNKFFVAVRLATTFKRVLFSNHSTVLYNGPSKGGL